MIGQEFIKRTKYRYMVPSDQERKLPQPPLETFLEEGGEVIPLPDSTEGITDLRSLIDSRTSIRNYADAPISLQDLSYLLWCTQGVKEVVGTQATLRTVPSAGARQYEEGADSFGRSCVQDGLRQDAGFPWREGSGHDGGRARDPPR